MRASLWFRQEIAKHLVRLADPLLYRIAGIWRILLRRTCFVAVTGSFGKTTTKECLARALQTRFRTFRSVRNQNARSLIALNLLRVRPWHKFAVIEVGIGAPGEMLRAAQLVRPDLAIITSIGGAHSTRFRTLERTAEEKMELLRAIRPGGTAIVNGDEPRLSEASSRGTFRLLRFGSSRDFALSASEVAADWPDRLSLKVTDPSGAIRLRTKHVGMHWVPSILASLLAARTCGIPLESAARAVENVMPFPARMQPIRLPQGATIIRDEYNSAEESYRESFRFLERAQACRKLLVATDFHSPRKRRLRLRFLGRAAADVADVAAFVGPFAGHACEAAIQGGMAAASVLRFSTPREAADWMKQELRRGDLVLLKGRTADHLSRLVFAQVGPVDCWRNTCKKRYLCDICWRLGTPDQQRELLEAL